MALLLPYKNVLPQIDVSTFVAPNATVIGDTIIGADCGIWYNVVIRGDVNEIRIGARTNIQDGAVIHVATHGQGSYIGDDVTVGHMALIHACTVEDKCLIGMKACVMDGARIGARTIIAAGAVVTPGKQIPSGQLWAGTPARYVRDLTEEDFKHLDWSAAHYVGLAKEYAAINAIMAAFPLAGEGRNT